MNIADRIEARFDRAVADARKRSAKFDHAWQAYERLDQVMKHRYVDGGYLPGFITQIYRKGELAHTGIVDASPPSSFIERVW